MSSCNMRTGLSFTYCQSFKNQIFLQPSVTSNVSLSNASSTEHNSSTQETANTTLRNLRSKRQDHNTILTEPWDPARHANIDQTVSNQECMCIEPSLRIRMKKNRTSKQLRIEDTILKNDIFLNREKEVLKLLSIPQEPQEE